jgi:hypothetical protein
MASLFRGASIRADFEDVLKTVGRGFAPRAEEELASPDADATASLHSSFEFLQALDTVSDRQSTPASPAADDLRSLYSEVELETEPEIATTEASHGVAAEAGLHRGDGGEARAGETEDFTRQHAPPEEPLARDDAPFPTTCDPLSLAAELGLKAGMTRAELQRLRRRFALANHPDRLSPSRREAASRRMTLANSLIDAALRRATRT